MSKQEEIRKRKEETQKLMSQSETLRQAIDKDDAFSALAILENNDLLNHFVTLFLT